MAKRRKKTKVRYITVAGTGHPKKKRITKKKARKHSVFSKGGLMPEAVIAKHARKLGRNPRALRIYKQVLGL
jgi:hypothetical protein